MNKFNMTFTKEQTEKALKHCCDFTCVGCPYNILSSKHLEIRCMHAMLEDVRDLYFEGKEQNKMDEKDEIIEYLLDVISDLAYTVACYKYPNRYSHSEDKEEILIDAGLSQEFRDRII